MKSALLGTAAGFVAMAGAQAADLPSRKAAAVEYVQICDAYGAGFFYIPGSNTCLKIGGRVRVDMWQTPAKNAGTLRSTATSTVPANTFVGKSQIDENGWYARGILNMDARTQTAWGTVQTVVALRLMTAGGLGNTPPGYSAAGFVNANANTSTVEAAYIRFAGFTFGDAAENFVFLPPYQYHSMYSPGFPNGVKQVAYTATFGGGFSATIALENRSDHGMSVNTNTLGANAGGLGGPNAAVIATNPARLPVLVGNLRVDQGWGSAQLSAAAIQNTATPTNPGLPYPMIKKSGWAVGAGLRINLPMLAAGDHIQFFASYVNGMMDFAGPTGLNGNTPVTANYLGGHLRFDRNMTVYCTTATSCFAENTKAFNIAGMFTHYWTPGLRSNFMAAWVRVTPGTVTQHTDWTLGGLSKATAYSLQSNLVWSPTAGFDIGLEIAYARLNQHLTGTAGAAPAALSALGQQVKISPSNWTGRMRVERTF